MTQSPFPIDATSGACDNIDAADVQCVADALPEDLSVEESKRAVEFIRQNIDVFSKSEYVLGRTNLVEHTIDTGNNKPVKQALRRHPVAYLPMIDQKVDEMLAHDIIQPMPGSEWVSNVVLVQRRMVVYGIVWTTDA